MADKRAVIYCSSSSDIDPVYNEAARRIVRAACLAGYDIVSGGSWRGTMGHVCDEALEHGVRVIGVLPRFMKGYEHPRLTECIWTDRMSQRKDVMREGIIRDIYRSDIRVIYSAEAGRKVCVPVW